MMSAGCAEGLLSRCTAPFGTRTKSPGRASTTVAPPGPWSRRVPATSTTVPEARPWSRRVPATSSACAREDVDHRLVVAVVVPAGHHAGVGADEPRPHPVAGERLLPIHPWRRRPLGAVTRGHHPDRVLGSTAHSPRRSPVGIPDATL